MGRLNAASAINIRTTSSLAAIISGTSGLGRSSTAMRPKLRNGPATALVERRAGSRNIRPEVKLPRSFRPGKRNVADATGSMAGRTPVIASSSPRSGERSEDGIAQPGMQITLNGGGRGRSRWSHASKRRLRRYESNRKALSLLTSSTSSMRSAWQAEQKAKAGAPVEGQRGETAHVRPGGKAVGDEEGMRCRLAPGRRQCIETPPQLMDPPASGPARELAAHIGGIDCAREKQSTLEQRLVGHARPDILEPHAARLRAGAAAAASSA